MPGLYSPYLAVNKSQLGYKWKNLELVALESSMNIALEDKSSPFLCSMVLMTRFVGQQTLITRYAEMGGWRI